MSEKKISILILDDEKRLREELGEFLSKLKFNTFLAEAPSKAFSILEKNKVDLAILDIRLPEMDGIKVLKIIKEKYPDIEIIMISGHGDMTTVIEAMRLGAFDYFSKPFRLLDVQNSIERTKKYITIQKRLKEVEGDFNLLSSNIIESMGGRQFIGKSHAVKQIISIMSKVAKTDNTSVLVTGESGTGKELVASGIHYMSARKNKYFYAINSTAVPEHLLESEFFGHKKGAFTGATEDKAGLFEKANKSTLFLDEIGDMQLNLQSKLLRVLEERKFRRIGSLEEISTDVRIVAATNQDLKELSKEKKFRLDLYHRLSSIIIHIPPLRERTEDIPLLIDHFVKDFGDKMNKPGLEVDDKVYALLSNYEFPGNVRELRNMIERAIILTDSNKLQASNFDVIEDNATEYQEENESKLSTFDLELLEKETIMRALQKTAYNKSNAAKLLNITWQSLHRKLKKHGIEE